MSWAGQRLGAERLRGAYAWKSLERTGALLAFGSDAPIEHENPWFGVHAAVTRQDQRGLPVGGWLSTEALDVRAALSAFTLGAARAVGDVDPTLRVGARADLTLVDRDPFETPAEDLWRVRTLGTWLDGREVYAGD
jgi:predicted amidohydrolase YtcJ